MYVIPFTRLTTKIAEQWGTKKHPSLHLPSRTLFPRVLCCFSSLLSSPPGCVCGSLVAAYSKVVIIAIATARLRVLGAGPHTFRNGLISYRQDVYVSSFLLPENEGRASLAWIQCFTWLTICQWVQSPRRHKSRSFPKAREMKCQPTVWKYKVGFQQPQKHCIRCIPHFVLIIKFVWGSFVCFLPCSYHMWTFFTGAVAGVTW